MFTDLAAFDTREVTLGRDDDVVPATAQLVSANYFRVLGARLARGRGFVDEEEREGGPAVVVISDLTWRTRFAADPSVVGKSLTIRGRDFQIIGIAAPDFTGADVGSGRPDVWVPLGATSIVAPGGMERLNSRFVSWLWIAGRLRPGVDARAAQAAMRPLFRQMQLDASGRCATICSSWPAWDSGLPTARSRMSSARRCLRSSPRCCSSRARISPLCCWRAGLLVNRRSAFASRSVPAGDASCDSS